VCHWLCQYEFSAGTEIKRHWQSQWHTFKTGWYVEQSSIVVGLESRSNHHY
jgi:hypothetical protein